MPYRTPAAPSPGNPSWATLLLCALGLHRDRVVDVPVSVLDGSKYTLVRFQCSRCAHTHVRMNGQMTVQNAIDAIDWLNEHRPGWDEGDAC